jgi:hypothetical protein
MTYGMKLITAEARGNRIAVVGWVEDWDEFQVFLFTQGILQGNATYHSEELADAIDTARVMVCEPGTATGGAL